MAIQTKYAIPKNPPVSFIKMNDAEDSGYIKVCSTHSNDGQNSLEKAMTDFPERPIYMYISRECGITVSIEDAEEFAHALLSMVKYAKELKENV